MTAAADEVCVENICTECDQQVQPRRERGGTIVTQCGGAGWEAGTEQGLCRNQKHRMQTAAT